MDKEELDKIPVGEALGLKVEWIDSHTKRRRTGVIHIISPHYIGVKDRNCVIVPLDYKYVKIKVLPPNHRTSELRDTPTMP